MSSLTMELPVLASHRRHNSWFGAAPYLARSNAIQTNWYTALTFVPKCLSLGFRKLSIVYFTIIVVIMLLGLRGSLFRSPLPPWGVLGTLVIIMLVNFWTEAREDLVRRREDREVNTRETIVVGDNGEETLTTWGSLQPGDYVKIFDNENIPADILLVKTHHVLDKESHSLVFSSMADLHDSGGGKDSSCFVETAGVDGETNLKTRHVPYGLMNHWNEDGVHPLCGTIEFPAPSSVLSLQGKFVPRGGAEEDVVHLESENMLLRGSILRNSKWVIGVVLYAGHDTKVMQAQSRNPSKLSKIEHLVNRLILMILTLFAIIVVITAIIQLKRRDEDLNLWYLRRTADAYKWIFPPALVSALVFIILYKNILPILLPIAIDICSAFSARAVSKDESMIFGETLQHAQCRSSSLIHEIGQIQWMFTDKTGTLTENNMRLVGLYCSQKYYGIKDLQDMEKFSISHDSTLRMFESLLEERIASGSKSSNLDSLLLALSYCHTVTIQRKLDETESEENGITGEEMEYDDSEEVAPAIIPTSQQQTTTRPPLQVVIGSARGDKLTSETLSPSSRSIANASQRGLRSDSLHEYTFHDVSRGGASFEYNAESPDELALVRGAQELGYQYMGVSRGVTKVQVYPPKAHLCDAVTDVGLNVSSLQLADNDGDKLQQYVHKSSKNLLDRNSTMGTTMSMGAMPKQDEDECLVKFEVNTGYPPLEQNLKLMAVNSFTSSRKCMSTLYYDSTQSRYVLFVKGADERVLPNCVMPRNDKSRIEQVLSKYARFGLRTLVVAHRYLNEDVVRTWLRRFRAARHEEFEVRKETYNSLAREIEQDLTFLGVTAIEDRLQDGVPETIQKIREAKVPLWVLTGDKVETAINISFSSKLIDQDSCMAKIVAGPTSEYPKGKSVEDLLRQIREYTKSFETMNGVKQDSSFPFSSILRRSTSGSLAKNNSIVTRVQVDDDEHDVTPNLNFRIASQPPDDVFETDSVSIRTERSGADSDKNNRDGKNPRESSDIEGSRRETWDGNFHAALVVDGKALELLLESEQGSDETECELMKLAKICHVFIGCRVSPAQKAAVVRMVQCRVSPTPVTLSIGDGANDVGMIQAANVGVGISGLEGTQAVSASNFSISQFRFLQQIMFVHGHYAYLRVAKAVGLIIYSSLVFTFASFSYNFYNDFSGQALFNEFWYTMWNVFVSSCAFMVGLFDVDYSPETLLENPKLYALGRTNRLLNERSMSFIILLAFTHAKLLFLLAVDNNLKLVPQQALAGTMYLCLVAVMSLRAVQISNTITWPLVGSLIFNLIWSVVCVSVANFVIARSTLIFVYYGAQFTWTFVFLCAGFLTAATTALRVIGTMPIEWLVKRLHWGFQGLLILGVFAGLAIVFYGRPS